MMKILGILFEIKVFKILWILGVNNFFENSVDSVNYLRNENLENSVNSWRKNSVNSVRSENLENSVG